MPDLLNRENGATISTKRSILAINNSGGGGLQMFGANNTPSSESLGTLTIGPGQTIISVTEGAGSSAAADLAFAGLVHRPGSQVVFETGDGSPLGGADRVMLGSYTTGSMPGWARLEVGSSLVSAAYDPTLGVIPYSQYVPSGGGAIGSIGSVPEPGAAGVLAVAAAGLLQRNRQGRRSKR